MQNFGQRTWKNSNGVHCTIVHVWFFKLYLYKVKVIDLQSIASNDLDAKVKGIVPIVVMSQLCRSSSCLSLRF